MSDDPRSLAARLLAQSRYALPLCEARAHIEARRSQLLARPVRASVPHPDFTVPAPLPIVDDPAGFAAEFWKDRAKMQSSPPHRPGRRPKAVETKPELRRFRVIDGKGPGDNPRDG